MKRTTVILIAVICVLAGGLVASLAIRPTPGLTETEVRSLISSAMANPGTEETAMRQNTASIDPATLHPMIESYLLANPGILTKMSNELSAQAKADEAARMKTAIASIHGEIFDDPDHVVIGNPKGDVTLVEMFDYNCTYCRAAMPDMAALLATDPNLRVVLKEFPILSQGSVDAARVAIAANQAGIDYWAFHSALFTGRGQVTGQTALDAAAGLGLNPVTLALDAKSADITKIIQRSYDIAQTLKITGTPTYIIGDDVIQGAIGLDQLKQLIANMRACGKTSCPS